MIKILGLRNFSLREHLFYAGILLVMTVIVILCFMFVKNNKSQLYSSADMRTQHQCLTLANPPDGQVHLSGTLVGDVAMYECDHGFNMTGDKTRVCQDDGTWSGTDAECKKNAFCVGAPVIANAGHDLAGHEDEFPLETVLKYTCNTGDLMSKTEDQFSYFNILERLPDIWVCSRQMFSLQ